MNLDDLKDQLREQFQVLSARVQESGPWNELQEKFQDLSPSAQKLVLASLGFLMFLIIFMVPYGFYSASQDSVAEFETKKQLMRDLYRVSREASSQPGSPAAIEVSALRSRMQDEINMSGIKPDQLATIQEFDNAGPRASAGLPKSLTQQGVFVMLKNLNLQQIVDLGRKFQSIRPTTKIVGLEVKAGAEDPHYFDVTYRVVAFNLPPEPAKKPAKK